VMNTDNMSILGLTIDYGPYGWLEDYTPDWTPNTTDAAGRRYSFRNQPQIAQWNLVKLANALYPLIGDAKPLQAAIDHFEQTYQTGWQAMMAQKLGFNIFEPETDTLFVKELFEILSLTETDYPIFFRNLARLDIHGDSPCNSPDKTTRIAPLMEAYYRPDQIDSRYLERLNPWLDSYSRRIHKDKMQTPKRRRQMNAVNPKYVLRNYMAQLAIDKAELSDFSLIHELQELLRHPYDEQPENEKWAKKRPDWARSKPGCSMLSCSS